MPSHSKAGMSKFQWRRQVEMCENMHFDYSINDKFNFIWPDFLAALYPLVQTQSSASKTALCLDDIGIELKIHLYPKSNSALWKQIEFYILWIFESVLQYLNLYLNILIWISAFEFVFHNFEVRFDSTCRTLWICCCSFSI